MSHPLRVQEQNEPQKISVFASANHAADAVAANLLSTVRNKPKSIPGLATGQTPRRVYAGLVAAFREGAVSFRDVTTFNLNEYCSLPASLRIPLPPSCSARFLVSPISPSIGST